MKNIVARLLMCWRRLCRVSDEVDGFVPCDGRLLSASDYPDLYAAIGVRFGHGPAGTFKVPDMRRVASFHPPEKRATHDMKVSGPRAGAMRVRRGGMCAMFWDAPLGQPSAPGDVS